MTGRKLAAPQKGFRCEYAARYIMSAYASTVPVPLQEDYYGHDLYCILTEKVGQFLIPLYPFVIQVRRNDKGYGKTIKYETKEAVKWFFSFGLPFYIGLCYIDEDPRLELYKTSEKIALVSYKGLPESVILRPNEHPKEPTKQYDENNIWLGKPIVTLRLGECSEPDPEIEKALWFWVKMDIENLSLKSNNVMIYYRCENYKTNKPPEASAGEGRHFYSTEGLPPERKRHFGLILHNLALWQFAGKDGNSAKKPWDDLQPDQRKLYSAFWQVLDFFSPEEANRFANRLKYPQPTPVQLSDSVSHDATLASTDV